MLNTGLRTAEALGLINSDIDLEKKVMPFKEVLKKRKSVTEQSEKADGKL